MTKKYNPPPPGKKWKFTRYITGANGERIPPPAGKKCWAFLVDE